MCITRPLESSKRPIVWDVKLTYSVLTVLDAGDSDLLATMSE